MASFSRLPFGGVLTLQDVRCLGMMPMRMMLILAAAASVLLAGCVGAPDLAASPGELQLSATWQDGEHMMVDVRNVGGTPVSLAGMGSMHLTGPNGTMPLHWSGMAPTLAPGESRMFELHAMHMEDGTMGMTMDHAMAGTHMPMPPGDYMLRMRDATATATLE